VGVLDVKELRLIDGEKAREAVMHEAGFRGGLGDKREQHGPNGCDLGDPGSSGSVRQEPGRDGVWEDSSPEIWKEEELSGVRGVREAEAIEKGAQECGGHGRDALRRRESRRGGDDVG
jgi:hypothetical protein